MQRLLWRRRGAVSGETKGRVEGTEQWRGCVNSGKSSGVAPDYVVVRTRCRETKRRLTEGEASSEGNHFRKLWASRGAVLWWLQLFVATSGRDALGVWSGARGRGGDGAREAESYEEAARRSIPRLPAWFAVPGEESSGTAAEVFVDFPGAAQSPQAGWLCRSGVVALVSCVQYGQGKRRYTRLLHFPAVGFGSPRLNYQSINTTTFPLTTAMPLRAHLPPPIRGCLGALAKLWLSFFFRQMASGPGSIVFGHHLIKGKSRHAMEDYYVAEIRRVNDHELGLFAIYDGHLGHNVADYLQHHLFNNILKESDFWRDTKGAIRKAYLQTDDTILEKAPDLGPGGSTAVTAILIDSKRLLVANVGDSRAIISRAGLAQQLSIDHEPSTERGNIENRGGFVSNMPGDVPRVDGQLAVARAFGDKSLKVHLSATPDIKELEIDEDTDYLILASDGLWKVMENQEAVELVKKIKDPTAAAKHLAAEAVNRKSKDDISCIVVRFK